MWGSGGRQELGSNSKRLQWGQNRKGDYFLVGGTSVRALEEKRRCWEGNPEPLASYPSGKWKGCRAAGGGQWARCPLPGLAVLHVCCMDSPPGCWPPTCSCALWVLPRATELILTAVWSTPFLLLLPCPSHVYNFSLPAFLIEYMNE